jgi:hypothetical protein
MNRIARKQIITLLFCFGWVGCANQPPMASDGFIVAGFDAQNHGIAGYRIGITPDTSVTLLDAKRKPLGRLVVVGSADTAGTGSVVRFQLDQQDLTKHIQLANGTYSVSDDATSYINAIEYRPMTRLERFSRTEPWRRRSRSTSSVSWAARAIATPSGKLSYISGGHVRSFVLYLHQQIL